MDDEKVVNKNSFNESVDQLLKEKSFAARHIKKVSSMAQSAGELDSDSSLTEEVPESKLGIYK